MSASLNELYSIVDAGDMSALIAWVENNLAEARVSAVADHLAEVERVCGPPPNNLKDAIAHAINRYSAENGSNTPDFILAEYLVDCLAAFDRAVTKRAEWYGRMDHPCADRPTVNPSEPPK
jgi:hypothetical protein